MKQLPVFGHQIELWGERIAGEVWHGDRRKAYIRKPEYNLRNFIARWHRTQDYTPGSNLPLLLIATYVLKLSLQH